LALAAHGLTDLPVAHFSARSRWSDRQRVRDGFDAVGDIMARIGKGFAEAMAET
jgi:hypothetical protein